MPPLRLIIALRSIRKFFNYGSVPQAVRLHLPGLLCILFLSVSCTLQEQESLVTETFELGNFSKITFEGTGAVTISQGDANSITIVSPSSIRAKIRHQITADTLQITLSDHLFTTPLNPDQSIQFHIVVKQVREIELCGSATLHVSGLTGSELSLNQQGVGSMEMTGIQCGLLKMTITGGGQVSVQGITREQQIILDGAITYDGTALQSDAVSAVLRGNARATVWAESSLTADVAPTAVLNYIGSPEYVVVSANAENVMPLE